MSVERKWFVVYTRARCEKKVAEHLTRNNIENYCPLNKKRRQWSDRKKNFEPLFTSYVFVHVTEGELTDMKKQSGVVNIVHWLGAPAVIQDYEVLTIQRFLNEHDNVRLEKTAVNMHDHVRVLNGPLLEKEGKYVTAYQKTVRVTLPSLGCMMVADVDVPSVEVLPVIPAKTEINQPLYAIK